MKLVHLKVENFRGIKTLDWHPDGSNICLIGPGDSCKTTILDAIEYALAPRNFLSFSDTDFFNGDVQQPIAIYASIGELPKEFFAEDAFGPFLRGHKTGQPLADDPEDGFEPVLTLKLLVDKDLEPAWHAVKTSNPDPKRLSWRDRERLGVTRLGNDAIRHFAWGRGSSLAKLTGKDQSAGEMLATVARVAQKTVSDSTLSELQKAADTVQKSAAALGVNLGPLRPGLDTHTLALGMGAISLHDTAIPLRAKGLGSRRVAALAIQQVGVGPDAITLIDEVEHGLEPFRLRQVLRKFCDGRHPNQPGGQVLMTSHSPTTIVARPVTDLRFVQCAQGNVTVTKVDPSQVPSLQRTARSRPHALLARKILVCEGKTEEALTRPLDLSWSQTHDNCSLAYHGVVAIDGEGSNAAAMALEFRRIGYITALFGDSDVAISPDPAALTAQGIALFQWEGKLATEQRITCDLPFADLQKFFDKACDLHGENRVLEACKTKSKELFPARTTVVGRSLQSWTKAGATEDEIRKLVGLAAKSTLNSWFKDLNAGNELGKIVVAALPSIPTTSLAKTVKALERWVYSQ